VFILAHLHAHWYVQVMKQHTRVCAAVVSSTKSPKAADKVSVWSVFASAAAMLCSSLKGHNGLASTESRGLVQAANSDDTPKRRSSQAKRKKGTPALPSSEWSTHPLVTHTQVARRLTATL
jgi:hypothetical protein